MTFPAEGSLPTLAAKPAEISIPHRLWRSVWMSVVGAAAGAVLAIIVLWAVLIVFALVIALVSFLLPAIPAHFGSPGDPSTTDGTSMGSLTRLAAQLGTLVGASLGFWRGVRGKND